MKYTLIVIGIVAFLAAALLGFLSFRKDKNIEDKNIVNPVALNEYANSTATVSFKTEGVINGNEQHRSIRMTVSKDSRTIEILGGYQGSVIKSQVYGNSKEAYKPFLASLELAGFTKEKKNPTIFNPEGQCPLGNKYFLSSTGIPNVPSSLWSSTCSAGGYGGGTMGTFDGTLSTIRTLFQDQIPDYRTITSGVNLY